MVRKEGLMERELRSGDAVQYYCENGGWRVGVYDHTVERGRKFGLMVIRRVIPSYEQTLFVKADRVKQLEVKDAEA